MKIRAGRARDMEELVALHRLLHEYSVGLNPRLWGAGPQEVSTWRALYQECLDSDSGAIFVAEEAGKLVGHVAGRVETREGATPQVVAYILTAFVREEWRNRGVGAALVRALLEFFSAKGVEDISLRYIIANREAERFWKGLGFEPLFCIANARPAEVHQHLEQKGRRGRH